MKDAQQEIKSTVTVNTSDITAKTNEDKEPNKEIEKLSRKRATGNRRLILNYVWIVYVNV